MPAWENCACPTCGRDRAEQYLQARDRFALAAGVHHTLQRCRHCGMVYLNPRPAEAESGQYYQHEEYLPFTSLAAPRTHLDRLYAALRRINLRWKRRLVSRFCSGSRLLDVGCGTGEFLAEMRDAGWQVAGLERDAAAAAWARDHLLLPVQTGSLAEFVPATPPFDAVTLWHVFEHLYAPQTALHRLRDLLRPEGRLLLAVPNIAGVDARVYGRHWVALDLPRHVNHFSLGTLVRCAAGSGFRLRWWQQLPLDAFFNSLMSERLQAHARRSGSWQWPLRLLRAAGVAGASLVAGSHNPFFAGSRGATLVTIFQKET